MTLQFILVIVGALLAQFGVFKLQKYLNDKKTKELNDKLSVQSLEIEGMKKEKEQRSREQTAGAEHRKRIKLTAKKTNELKTQIAEATSEEDIESILDLIDSDNNFRIKL